jgi:hypothetical protein
MRVGAAWIKRTTIGRRSGLADVFVGWIRLEDGRPAATSRSIDAWGKEKARALVLAWIREQRRGIRERWKLAPHRFPAIVHRPTSGPARLSR